MFNRFCSILKTALRFELPQFVWTVQKTPMQAIFGFKRSGAVLAAPLQFYSECARSYRSEYIYRSDHSLPGMSLACAGKCTLF